MEIRVVRQLGKSYVFLFQDLHGFADLPLTVGAYLPLEDAARQISRIKLIPFVGALALIAAPLISVFLGRALSRPVHRLAAAAGHIRRLDIDSAPTLSKGIFRELNEAAAAFNTMVAGLRSFETYVPRFLVARLIEQHGGEDIQSENREITVLFTDIVGFTETAEKMSPRDLATYLNHHFAIVGREVEAEHGTTDKYIGDAVMAFWGAPEIQEDQAQRACRAAVAIGHAIRDDNMSRREAGLSPVRIRMGIHKGSAIVGNIGSASRINYTIVGDTVNIAERIEEQSRLLISESREVGILISDEVAKELNGSIELREAGQFVPRGKAGTVSLQEILELPRTFADGIDTSNHIK
jgi:class 3 adenylate cyclase